MMGLDEVAQGIVLLLFSVCALLQVIATSNSQETKKPSIVGSGAGRESESCHSDQRLAPDDEALMSARIFSPAKTAMQSVKAKTGFWVLEFDAEQPRKIDPLMGYTTSGDMKSQIRLAFNTKEEAVAYAQKHGLEFRVQEPKEAKRRQISYAENFRYDRKIPWTH